MQFTTDLKRLNMFTITISILILIALFYWFLKGPNQPKKEFPEPPGHFLFGHVFIADSPESSSNHSRSIYIFLAFLDVLDGIDETFKMIKGKTGKTRFGLSKAPILTAVGTTDYKLCELILSSNHHLTKFRVNDFLKPWLGNGLLVSDGDYWRRHRKMLTPAFHFGILKQFVETFDNVGNIFIKKLRKYDGMKSVDLQPLVTLCTLDIICESAMGTKINAQSDENSPYVKSVKEMTSIIITRLLSPLKILDETFWLTKDYYIQKRALKILHGFSTKVINARRNKTENKASKKLAFLDLMLKFCDDDGIKFTDAEVREEVDTFMFEGHDTTSSAICFTLYCLAEYQDIQRKVLEEQQYLFDDEKNPSISYSHLQEMKYLDNVIKETLRIYPPVPIIGRYIHEDIHYEDYVIPKNTNVGIYIYGLHRDPEYFPEPEKFNPDRFDVYDGTTPFCYVPFSAGPRNCIGQKFVMLVLKSVISKVVRNFELVPAEPHHTLKLSLEAVLKSANGVKIGLRIRD